MELFFIFSHESHSFRKIRYRKKKKLIVELRIFRNNSRILFYGMMKKLENLYVIGMNELTSNTSVQSIALGALHFERVVRPTSPHQLKSKLNDQNENII